MKTETPPQEPGDNPTTPRPKVQVGRKSKNGRNSTMFTDKNGFTADDICKIVKECGQSGVSYLELENLKVEFHQPAKVNEDDASLGQARPEDIQKQIEKAEKIAAFELLKKNQEHEDEVIDNLQIEDPHLYEELLSRGDIEDEEAQD